MSTATANSLWDVSLPWKGETSDLARQYYRRHLARESVARRKYLNIPDAIQLRLNATGTTFDQLPGLLQRALVWDTGYVENGNFNGSDDTAIPLVRVRTKNGISMAEIAVGPDEYSKTKCTTWACNGVGYTWKKTNYCRGNATLSVSLCMVDPFEDPGRSTPTATWSFGATDTAIPAMRLLRHLWRDVDTTQYEVAAIHTSEASIEPYFERCAYDREDTKAISSGSLVIPLQSHEVADTKRVRDEVAQAVRPPTAAPTTVPAPAPTQPENGTNLIVIIAPAIAVVLLAVGTLIWCYRRRSRPEAEVDEVQSSQPVGNFMPVRSPRYPDALPLGTSSAKKGPGVGSTHASTGSSGSHPSTFSLDGNVEAAFEAIVQTLMIDPRLTGKQIPYDQIELANQVSTGAFGEVWFGYRNHEIVAIKRLLRTKYHTGRDVEAFAQEIQLSARLHHPNIVRFIGVSWSKQEDLCLVMEYLPAGDLSKVLRESGTQLTWNRHKIGMARALASAVAYLHSQSPAIIHRDLKSKNVLLTTTLEPKVIDFGVSRRKVDDTMTAGIGTPYWTAPEVLEGLRYTEKSDIYTLGVLFTELDTCQIPYYDVRNDSGGMIHLKILNDVVSGKLRPSVTETCPDVIREVVVCCLRQDPAKRPTAAEVLWMLA